jgi:hypothetical protein
MGKMGAYGAKKCRLHAMEKNTPMTSRPKHFPE